MQLDAELSMCVYERDCKDFVLGSSIVFSHTTPIRDFSSNYLRRRQHAVVSMKPFCYILLAQVEFYTTSQYLRLRGGSFGHDHGDYRACIKSQHGL